jgi:genome maintenance exonuclease 1
MRFEYCPPIEIPSLSAVTLPDGKRYYTTPSGKQVPSVTTVVGFQKRKQIMEWRRRVGEEEANRISKKATSRGNNVHKVCEDYLNNNMDYMKNVMPDSLEMFLSIKPYLNRISNIHYQEQSLWSDMLGLAGRCDCIGQYEGELASIDFKTSRKPKKKEDIVDYFQQTTAYALMHEEITGIPINKLVIIMAVEDSPPLIFIEETANYIDSLVEAIDIYKKNNV